VYRFWPLVVAALAVATLAPIAAATAPTRTTIPFESTRVIAASADTCPFDIRVHSSGLFQETVFSDGRDVTTVSDFHITWTNTSNGREIKSALAGPFVIEPNADGTVTVIIDGNNGHFAGQGEGSIFAQVGRLVYIADAADPFTPLDVLQSTGQQDPSLFPAVCPALG
jgi:hypothetical protein